MSWSATSACGHGCLPPRGTVPRVPVALAAGRVLALVAVLVAGIGVAFVVPLLGKAGRARAVRGWFRAVVAATGVRLMVTGEGRLSDPGSALVTSNHLSWLDIPALLAVRPLRVLAKSDVRRWPVLGYLAARGGTLFIDRNRLRRLPGTVAGIAATLRAGDSVLVFPEGSTWCGRTGGAYRPATLQAAIDAAVPVRPLALRYRLADGSPTTVAAWVGTDSLVASVWRIAATRGLRVEVEVGTPLPTTGRSRRELAAAAAGPRKGRTSQPQAVHVT